MYNFIAPDLLETQSKLTSSSDNSVDDNDDSGGNSTHIAIQHYNVVPSNQAHHSLGSFACLLACVLVENMGNLWQYLLFNKQQPFRSYSHYCDKFLSIVVVFVVVVICVCYFLFVDILTAFWIRLSVFILCLLRVIWTLYSLFITCKCF